MLYTRAYVRLLSDTISELRARNERLEVERSELLNRLLERRNIEPLRESTDEQTVQARSPIQIISPSSSMLPEMEDAVKNSWIREEMAYIQQIEGVENEDVAESLANDRYVQYFRVIK